MYNRHRDSRGAHAARKASPPPQKVAVQLGPRGMSCNVYIYYSAGGKLDQTATIANPATSRCRCITRGRTVPASVVLI